MTFFKVKKKYFINEYKVITKYKRISLIKVNIYRYTILNRTPHIKYIPCPAKKNR